MMKKTALIFALAMSLPLAACSKDDQTSATSANDSQSSTTQSTDTTPVATTPKSTDAPSSTTKPAGTTAADSQPANVSAETPAAYTKIIADYAAALHQKSGGSTLVEKNLNHMLADCYGDAPLQNIGYAVADLDKNGTLELAIGTTSAVKDVFYSKLIFDLYTLDQSGKCVKLIDSSERNRFYYAGENRFANLGSSGAEYSFETTLKLQGAETLDMTQTTKPANYVQMPMQAFQ